MTGKLKIILEKIEFITANLLSIFYVGWVGMIDWNTTLTIDKIVELVIAIGVGISVIVWNISRAKYMKSKRKLNESTIRKNNSSSN